MEQATWAVIAAVTIAYITQRHKQVVKERPPIVQLSAGNELDPKRWRHNGAQPTHYGTFDGNKQHVRDKVVLDLMPRIGF